MINAIARVFFIVCIALISACTSYKDISYLQDIPSGYTQEGEDNYELRIRPDDLIAIMVNSKDPELAQMFNLALVAYQVGGRVSTSNSVLGYLVDKKGEINFPQLGRIKVEGLTRSELTNHVEKMLTEKGYINDPIVTVQFLNFKVSVLGEVMRPGAIEVTSDRITIFDALSAAGDLTIYGKRENVKIIRDIDGKKTISIIDLRSATILDSPFYYLQQNDVVYVEPNKAKAGQREINANRSVGTYASIISVFLSAISLVLSVI